jgi:hypothetical protein
VVDDADPVVAAAFVLKMLWYAPLYASKLAKSFMVKVLA